MHARARTALGTAFLAVVLTVVAAVAYVGVHLRGEERASGEEREKKLFAFAPKDVRELRITTNGGTVVVARGGEGGAWRITAPIQAPADGPAVDRVVARLAALERRGVSAKAGEGKDELSRFGLAEPNARVEAVLADGRTERLALGDGSGFDGAMFVMPTDGRVIVVSGDTRDALARGLNELRDRRVLPGVKREDVAAVRFESPRGAFEVRRAPLAAHPERSARGAGAESREPAWRITGPTEAPADAAKVGDLVRAITLLEGAAVADERGDRLAAAGLAPPRSTVVLRAADGKELGRLLVGGDAGGRVHVKSGASPVVWDVVSASLPAIPARPADIEERPGKGAPAAKPGG